MGETRSTCEGKDKFKQAFSKEALGGGGSHVEETGVDGKMILRDESSGSGI
jgi:hypothetical protein